MANNKETPHFRSNWSPHLQNPSLSASGEQLSNPLYPTSSNTTSLQSQPSPPNKGIYQSNLPTNNTQLYSPNLNQPNSNQPTNTPQMYSPNPNQPNSMPQQINQGQPIQQINPGQPAQQMVYAQQINPSQYQQPSPQQVHPTYAINPQQNYQQVGYHSGPIPVGAVVSGSPQVALTRQISSPQLTAYPPQQIYQPGAQVIMSQPNHMIVQPNQQYYTTSYPGQPQMIYQGQPGVVPGQPQVIYQGQPGVVSVTQPGMVRAAPPQYVMGNQPPPVYVTPGSPMVTTVVYEDYHDHGHHHHGHHHHGHHHHHHC